MTTAAPQPFQFPRYASGSLRGFCRNAIAGLCERALGFPALGHIYAQARAETEPAFCERVLRVLGVEIEVSEPELSALPTEGPLLVVANHPLGGLDGIVLAALLQRKRADARLLANYLLERIPEMHESCLFVDPFGGPRAAGRNRAEMRSAVRWLQDGGALGVFPAGEVSHFTFERGSVVDSRWSDAAARLALRTGATVVPMYFHGCNSHLFQALGLLHSRLRTALLPRELLRRQGTVVRVEIGTPIKPERLARLACRAHPDGRPTAAVVRTVTEYLRLRTYILKSRNRGSVQPARSLRTKRRPHRPIVSATAREMLAADVAALPASQSLLASGALRVFYGSAAQLPNVLREIGRLRETTFRLVGEGTGREIDLDPFDQHYLHLFVWDSHSDRVIGAYRMAQTDIVLRQFGVDGLYTSTLFRYEPRLIDSLSPALELGRSFIIPEHQRDFAPLLLLWKGIGRFVALNPRYRQLFGAVSISDDFQSMTKQLLMAFLRAHSFDASLAGMVTPRRPPEPQRIGRADAAHMAAFVSDVADAEELIHEIESGRRGMPVLLRHYLKLNAKLLGFNVDPNFGDVVDGLVLVDLTTVDRRTLNRYLGPDGAESFLGFHGAAEAAR